MIDFVVSISAFHSFFFLMFTTFIFCEESLGLVLLKYEFPDTTDHESVRINFICMIRLAPMQFICGDIEDSLGILGRV